MIKYYVYNTHALVVLDSERNEECIDFSKGFLFVLSIVDNVSGRHAETFLIGPSVVLKIEPSWYLLSTHSCIEEAIH